MALAAFPMENWAFGGKTGKVFTYILFGLFFPNFKLFVLEYIQQCCDNFR